MHAPDSDTKSEAPRRPYVAPDIEETSDFDTLALSCAGTAFDCDPNDPFDPREPSS
jgi:hypothetical protein